MNVSKRLKFFLSHLATSICVAAVAIGIVFYIWYPSPLANAVGVTDIFLMLIAIDVIVGPILGLLVYKEGKRTLKMDLSIIILIQFLAFGYGIYSIAQGRPAWIVYNVDRFELVRVNELIIEKMNKVPQEYKEVSWFKPQFVGVELAKDRKTRSNDLFNEAVMGVSIAQNPSRYIPINNMKKQIQQRAKNLNLLEKYNDQRKVEKILVDYPQATAYVPLKSNAIDMTVLITKDGDVIKVVDLRPWL